MSTDAPAKTLILNVDDNDAARYARGRVLQHAGYDVVDAANGSDAMALASERRPQVAVLDVHLPDINGLELSRRIKTQWPDVMVLQTSATFITAQDRARGLEGGADAYLIEPVDPGELVATINALVRLRNAEDQLRRLNQSLEERIAERTQRLHRANIGLIEQIARRERAEEVMLQAQHMEAVGMTTSAAAHDFVGILTAIDDAVRRSLDYPETARTHLESAMRHAQSGLELGRKLLAYAAPSDVELRPVDVGAVLSGMRAWLGRGGSTVAVAPQQKRLMARTDGNRLELVLFSLARKVAGDPAAPIAIAAEIRDGRGTAPEDSGPHVVVTISRTDAGTTRITGADPVELKRWADENLRIAEETGRYANATIDFRDVERHAVELWLPVADDADIDADAALPAAKAAPPSGCVLIVDDDRETRTSLRGALQAAGLAVVAAGSGPEAIALARRLDVALVIVDFAMPGMNRVEVARVLRERKPSLPLIFLTALGDREDIEEAMPRSAVISKPVDPDAVVGAATLLLGDARSGTERR